MAGAAGKTVGKGKNDNPLKKVNDMSVRLFEMQEKIRAKELNKVQKEQDEKLIRLKKEKDILARQTGKIKTEFNQKNGKLKEQIERCKVAKNAYAMKQ